MTWNLKETLEKTEKQLRELAANMEASKPTFDPYEANIYGTGPGQTLLKADDQNTLSETIKQWRSLSLKEFLEKCAHISNCSLKEFIAKSGALSTSGILGANYLIPVKIYDILYMYACERDIVPDISAAILGPDEIPGTTLNVDIAVDDTYYVTPYSSGGNLPEKAITTTQATLDFSTPWGIHFNITEDMIEDSKFSLIELHVQKAGEEMGEYASEQAIVKLHAAGTGDGIANSTNADNDFTELSHVANGYSENLLDGFVSDILLCSRHVWLHKIMQDVTYTAYDTNFHTAASQALSYASASPTSPAPFGLKPIFFDIGGKVSTINPEADQTEMNSYVITKRYSLLSGRKRWLKIENYSNPIADLRGAVVSARQDSITLYKDATCRIDET